VTFAEEEQATLTRKHGDNREDLIRALELGRDDEHLCKLRVERHLGHDLSELGDVSLIVECCEVVEELKCTHE
jgi:hypothetical protein